MGRGEESRGERLYNRNIETKFSERKKMEFRAPNAGVGFGTEKHWWSLVMKNTPLESPGLQAARQQHHQSAGGSGQAPYLTQAVGSGVRARLLDSSPGSATNQYVT